ncbi:double-stranded RNA-specific adenosine deaminase-like [Rhopilema esculentum]|uniref:double-stranded RNA-specific adenosine deaminase-like n=1 Tax=Rhopilema esculentum TaxID=499914 RepID=UPI0031CDB31D|eukprot:gene13146-3937_t
MSLSSDLEERILDALRTSQTAIVTHQLSKNVGLVSAKDVNPTLYSLEKRGLIKKVTTENNQVGWQIAKNDHLEAAAGIAVKNQLHLFPGNETETGPSAKCSKHEKELSRSVAHDMDVDAPVQDVKKEQVKHRQGGWDQRENIFGLSSQLLPVAPDSAMTQRFVVPKAPHEMIKPSGRRTKILANALHRDTTNHGSTRLQMSQISTSQEMPGASHVQHGSSYGKRRYEHSDSSAFIYPAEHQQGLSSEGFHQVERGTSDQRMEEAILACLQQFNRPYSTLELARAVNKKTKTEVNPVLYDMQRRGLIIKTTMQPPAWKLAPYDVCQNVQKFDETPRLHQHISSTCIPRNPVEASIDEQYSVNQSTREKIPRQLSWPSSEEVSTALKYSQCQNENPVLPVQSSEPSKEFSEISFTALSKNPVSAINEFAQRNQQPISFEILHEGKGGKNRFLVAVKLNGRMYDAVSAPNIKEARREAADVALREILSRESITQNNTKNIDGLSRTHFDNIAALSHQTFIKISSEIKEKFAGRKVIAALVMKTYEDQTGVVVSIGAGNRCITGDRLTLEGMTVNDSHAEIICRRAFLAFLYSELDQFYKNENSVFENGGVDGKLQVKDGITWHLYISTAPCGDSALFSPRECETIKTIPTRDHSPLYTSKQQGLLRTKIEDGEGTIPIDENDGPQTWDGIVRGKRLRTMSCSDKVCRWNILGLQGALLSHLIEPVYLDSLTLGYLYEHGHLSRAVCCRLDKNSRIDDQLPIPFSLNHPWIGRVSAYSPHRETEKTNNLSINWFLGSPGVEVTDGRTGACLTRTSNAPTPSRLCKAKLYKSFKDLCLKSVHLKYLAGFETYREAKEKAETFQKAKDVMINQLKKSKFGSWVKKPRELELFDS